ncbi:tRNA synthetase Glu [Thermoplasma volcanium GSS1]|uniref:Glutamate--tRNA ligase n=1 Tax=Thermoplasma volcanium (strain ATCC 51530 / DSM 4299 / JCM 9571 / NBRC 15438 / GSS1) TaxID=273116 RepID=SYE_THEVO|nr:glutamate--tRNA ligase [Thermoplasma volcanium]Q979Q0.1 RecName: Full=Glutamate--tRNA ligase; AltName: Full=Glutamyl-tRNA synthetase; Short=GluRS [Thermoplasma volcanium GSS1]BAB60252.1 tRNA synthetase Glu [Thermoplasma volcanium GSS1]
MYEEEIKKIALLNAYQHNGKAELKSVIGKVMAEIADLRKNPKLVSELAKAAVDSVNSMSKDDIVNIVEKQFPEALKKDKKPEEHRLPDLQGVNGHVVMRLAPSPSGPLHIGHTRMAILNDEYVKRYGGDLILRIEDTNPTNIDPEAYAMIPEDLEWLGVNVTKTVIQSERFDLYYSVAKKLIENGHLYICTCDREEFKRKKLASIPCKDRDNPPETNLYLFEKMLDGEIKAGAAVAVMKTDLNHPNPSVRDWIAFRIIDAKHPRTGDKYRVFPMMSFSVAVDDHYLGLTHVLRGKDQLTNTEKQRYVFEYNGWNKPYYYHYGMIRFPGTRLKTSLMKKGIQAGQYDGWSDVRLGTVRAMARRGYQPETFRRYWINSGLREIDAVFSWEIFNSLNREFVDPKAYRFSFTKDPVEIKMEGSNGLTARLPYHPSHPEYGVRKYEIGDTVYISKGDADKIADGERFRLKDLCYVVRKGDRFLFDGTEMKEKTKIINWCPPNSREFQVLKPDGSIDKGLIEPASKGYRGISQLERYGYVNFYDSDEKAYFTHD